MQDIIVISPGKGKTVALGPTQLTFLARSEETDHQFSLVEHILPPQSRGAPPHVHRLHNHAFFVIEGEVRIDVGDQMVLASTGTYVFVPKGVPHSFSNPGAVWARMLHIDTPGGMEKIFDELSTAISPGASVDHTVAERIHLKYDTYPPSQR
jgi:mannose-6-phosphate isomerase-like protein (cupin superfamily)